MMPRIAARAPGFTLVEAIIVIMLTAIVVGMVAMFIRLPFLTQLDVKARAELSDAADTALRRVARDVRLALPNSVRQSGDYLELLPTKTGGRYLDEEDGVAGFPLQFEKAGLNCALTPADAACKFSVLGAMPAAPLDIVAGDQIVVYNLGISEASAWENNKNRATVAQVSGNEVRLSNQPFATQNPALRSPTKRFQVVSTPVTYFCDKANRRLLRYAGYAISAIQPTPPSGPGLQTALVVDGVENCVFSYDSLANQHTALLGMRLALRRPGAGDSGKVELYHQMHIDNTP
ncbi:prepilin-type cleavage/methylation domain-containing protein [Massilia sp. W12]|uniref:PulJ/GspJ family protein n=1 Tax=Massilia sp. W12 TaxID=3126507 RepID=UPI0030D5593F